LRFAEFIKSDANKLSDASIPVEYKLINYHIISNKEKNAAGRQAEKDYTGIITLNRAPCPALPRPDSRQN
jgi:hypothetical protein